MKPGPFWTRLAAASGMEYAVLIAIAAIIGEVKDLETADLALVASNEVFGVTTLFTGFAAMLLFWFASTLAARLRQLEGGSGRLAAAVNGSGAIIAGIIAVSVGVLYGARSAGSAELGSLAAALLDGPGLLFPAAVFVGATGIVGVRAEGLPIYSSVLARLSIGLSAAYAAFAGLMLFKNYAWINETSYITFTVWVFALSLIGVIRWTEMDSGGTTARPARPARPAPAPTVPLVSEETRPLPRARARKPATARKPRKR